MAGLEFYPGYIDARLVADHIRHSSMSDTETFTAFAGHELVVTGSLEVVARTLAARETASPPIAIFGDADGKPVELDLRHGAHHAIAEYRARTAPAPAPIRQGRGRPKLGVVAREVTLLPRHWEWLAGQSGGASATLPAATAVRIMR